MARSQAVEDTAAGTTLPHTHTQYLTHTPTQPTPRSGAWAGPRRASRLRRPRAAPAHRTAAALPAPRPSHVHAAVGAASRGPAGPGPKPGPARRIAAPRSASSLAPGPTPRWHWKLTPSLLVPVRPCPGPLIVPSEPRAGSERRAAPREPRRGRCFRTEQGKVGNTGCLEAWRKCGSRRSVECRQSAAWRGASAAPARRGGVSLLARQVGSPQTKHRHQVRTTDDL